MVELLHRPHFMLDRRCWSRKLAEVAAEASVSYVLGSQNVIFGFSVDAATAALTPISGLPWSAPTCDAGTGLLQGCRESDGVPVSEVLTKPRVDAACC